jgi:transposase InsO family protein
MESIYTDEYRYGARCIEQALHDRGMPKNVIHHSDRGVQYLSIRYTNRLEAANLRASVGTTGDSYDNALAETVNGLYKTEVIEYWLCCTNLSVKGFSAI